MDLLGQLQGFEGCLRCAEAILPVTRDWQSAILHRSNKHILNQNAAGRNVRLCIADVHVRELDPRRDERMPVVAQPVDAIDEYCVRPADRLDIRFALPTIQSDLERDAYGH